MTAGSPGDALHLSPHRLAIALFQPQIAPNTGNIGRLCVATGAELRLIRPLGFRLDDRNLRRSAMDYWPRLKLTVHDDDAAFFSAHPDRRIWFFSTTGQRSLWDTRFENGDILAFGSETHGLDRALLRQRSDQVIRIPQSPGERCLNLSTAAGIALYEALRRVGQVRD